MKKNDIETVLNVLNDFADDLKERIDAYESYYSRMNFLKESVKDSNLSVDDKFSLGNLVFEKSWELSDLISVNEQKLNAIDLFVSELNEWVKYPERACILIDVEVENV